MSLSLAPSGEGAIQSFRLTNPSTDTVAVKVSVVSRQMDIDGVETLQPADELFTVYPSRVVLRPNSVQVVKVQWKGPSDISVERNFRIVAEQVPVDFNGQKEGNIRILLRYMGTLYVTPPDAMPNVVLDSLAPTTVSDHPALAVTLRNDGTAHVILDNLTLEVRGRGSSRKYSSDELAGFSGENMLAGVKRTFVVPLPPELVGGDYSVAFHFDPLR